MALIGLRPLSIPKGKSQGSPDGLSTEWQRRLSQPDTSRDGDQGT